MTFGKPLENTLLFFVFEELKNLEANKTETFAT